MVSVIKDGIAYNVRDELVGQYIARGYTVEQTEEPHPVAVESVPETVAEVEETVAEEKTEEVTEVEKTKKPKKGRSNKNK